MGHGKANGSTVLKRTVLMNEAGEEEDGITSLLCTTEIRTEIQVRGMLRDEARRADIRT